MNSRRSFLKQTLIAANGITLAASKETQNTNQSERIIDVNVNMGHWPTRRLRGDDSSNRLLNKRVREAWVGRFEGLLHKDLTAVNNRLAAECRGNPHFVPFASINPMLPGWKEELTRCAEHHRIRGIRLHPNYHGYSLTDPKFRALLIAARDLRVIVQLAVVMEDERMMHPLLRVEAVALEPLPALVHEIPDLQLILLNAFRTGREPLLRDLSSSGDVYVEISMLEGVGGIETLLSNIPVERVLFGSHAPLFYFESAALKLKESDLTADQLRAITHGNAAKILANAR